MNDIQHQNPLHYAATYSATEGQRVIPFTTLADITEQ